MSVDLSRTDIESRGDTPVKDEVESMKNDGPIGGIMACLELEGGRTFCFDEEPTGVAPQGYEGPYGFYPMSIGVTLKNSNGRIFEVVRKLGWSTSSSVWLGQTAETSDDATQSPRYVAIKVLTAGETSELKSGFSRELENLRIIATKDQNHVGYKHCLQLEDVWYSQSLWGPHLCLATQVLGGSLSELRRKMPKLALPVPAVKRIIRQTLLALDYIHNVCGLVHTDVKPDNTLIILQGISNIDITRYIQDHPSETYSPVIEPEVSPDPIITVKSQPLPNFGLNKDFSNIQVCIADFGSARLPNIFAFKEVQPEALRAPEVNLRYGWSFPIDVWTVGCLVFEYLVGSALFQLQRTATAGFIDVHLRRILEHFGPGCFTEAFLSKCEWRNDFFKKDGTLWAPDPMKPRPVEDCLRNYNIMKEEDIPAAGAFIRRCIVVDPTLRPTAAELIQDEWLKDAGGMDVAAL